MAMQKKVLVVGSGGREHALCWKLAQSPRVSQVYCAPGNGGTAREAKTANVPIPVTDFEAIAEFAIQNQIDLTVIGPDNPLADGIVDVLEAKGLAVFGPVQQAAQLEGSKVFAKEFMQTHGLPTAQFAVFSELAPALDFCRVTPRARVIKVDGLALGKGVYVCDSVADCEAALREIFEARRFGASGTRVVIEERLFGPEISLMILCDGKTMVPLTSSQDYKRRFEGNTGPNTGGMGVYSPVPLYADYKAVIQKQILTPLQAALQAADFTYCGLLYVGLLIHNGQPYILEFNARFGDPETQCVLPRLQNDLYDLLEACVTGNLADHRLSWREEASVCVVAVAETYPEQGAKGQPITIDALPKGVLLFHAGTALAEDGRLITQGGRVLNVIGLGQDLDAAAQTAYAGIGQIHFEGMAYRRDIAKEVALCPST